MAKSKRRAEKEVFEVVAEGDEAPATFNFVVYMIMLILGLGLLTPWNVVLNA